MPRVDLISNVFHYYYTALALQRCGYLGQYISGPGARDDEAWLQRLGPVFRRLWIERRLEGIPPASVKRLWLPEVMQKAFTRLGNPEYANELCGEMFARRAADMTHDCDAVHFVQGVGWAAAQNASRRGAKVICDMREEHPRFQMDILAEEAERLGIEYRARGESIRQRVLQEIDIADHIFCPSSYAKRTFVERGVDERKLLICPYGVNTARFAPRERPMRKEFCVLFLGQVCMRKGVQYLLEGYKKAALPNARLVLAGPVDPPFRVILDRYRGLFEELGSVPHSQVEENYFAADVFVMPSLADSYGLVVSEAMSAGLAVIVSENTGMADFIKNGREGFVVPIRDGDAIAGRLTYLYENRDQGLAMGAAGIATARLLDWSNYQEICGRFYKSLFQPIPQTVPVRL